MFLTAAGLCFAACGKKKDSGPPQPVLTAPDKTDAASAQAEVKASSGPIELSLLLHKTQIKAGDSLWEQIRIRNVGAKKINIVDQVFFDDRALRNQSNIGYGIYLEARDPEDKPLKVWFYGPAKRAFDIDERPSGLLEVEGPQERAMLDGWKKQGLSAYEIDLKLIDFNTKKQRAAEHEQERPFVKLMPGQSAETKSAFSYNEMDMLRNRPRPHAIGEFTRVDFFEFKKPGTYKVRAVYNNLAGELSRKVGLPIYPEEVLVRTPWIPVTVFP